MSLFAIACAHRTWNPSFQSKALDAIFYRLNCHCIFILVMKQPLCIQVNEQIVVTASVLFDCDAFEEKRYPGFQSIGRHLKKISSIHCENWDVLKLATAFNIICSHEIGDSDEMFSKDLQTKLLNDADKYEYKVDKLVCMLHYKQLLDNYRIKTSHKDMLAVLVKKAKEAHEAELAVSHEKPSNEPPAAK